MIKTINGNILNASENIAAQQCNTKFKMGAGLALQISKKYPNVYSAYKEYLNKNKNPLGTILNIEVNKNKIVSCLFAQDDYGRSKKVYTNYRALEECLTKLNIYAINNKYSIAIPYGIGCGLANGDWNIVYPMIERVFENNNNVVIYKSSYNVAWKQ
jgi:O-acetyl-ADP-ribose deacetylase (regulator of RNase III)